MTNREKPAYFNVFERPWRASPGEHECVHNLPVRLLSRDTRTAAATYMVDVPAGWRRTLKTDQSLEIFVLAGDLSVNRESVGSSGFIGVPQDCGPVELASRGGSVAYMFVTPDLPLPAYTSGIHVKRMWREPWVGVDMATVRHGLMFKSLRVPDPATAAVHGGPGGFLRMTLNTPGFMEPRHEVHHSCWEEIIILTGDLMMKDRGIHAAGTYLGNPANLWHAPFATAGGCLLLIHCDAPMDVEFRRYDGGYPFLADYLDTTSWLDQPKHTCWPNSVELEYWTGETAAGVAGIKDPAARVGPTDSCVEDA